jgi:hypothetical protein
MVLLILLRIALPKTKTSSTAMMSTEILIPVLTQPLTGNQTHRHGEPKLIATLAIGITISVMTLRM